MTDCVCVRERESVCVCIWALEVEAKGFSWRPSRCKLSSKHVNWHKRGWLRFRIGGLQKNEQHFSWKLILPLRRSRATTDLFHLDDWCASLQAPSPETCRVFAPLMFTDSGLRPWKWNEMEWEVNFFFNSWLVPDPKKNLNSNAHSLTNSCKYTVLCPVLCSLMDVFSFSLKTKNQNCSIVPD